MEKVYKCYYCEVVYIERFKNNHQCHSDMVADMMNRKSIARLYLCMQTYDAAPSFVEKWYKDVKDDPDKIEKKTMEFLRKPNGDLAKQAIGRTHNYATITSILQNGNVEKATEYINFLSEKESLIIVFNDLLKNFNTSYLEQCLINKQFMVPKTLDKALFGMWASESASEWDSYYEHDAVNIISSLDDDKFLYTGLQKKEVGGVINFPGQSTRALFSSTTNYSQSIRFPGPREPYVKSIIKHMEDKGISDYCFIYSKHEGMNLYLLNRFLIISIGEKSKKEVLESDMKLKSIELGK